MNSEVDDYIINHLEKEATTRGITLDALFDQLAKMMALVNKPLQESGRLPYVEQLLCNDTVAKDQADMILRNNPLLEPEVRGLIIDAQEVLGREFGLEIPENYIYIFDTDLNRIGFICDFVDPIKRTVTVPSKVGIFTPVVIGHILGHIFQNENSNVMQELRAEYAVGGADAYNQKYQDCVEVIEGWAVFLSRLYAKKRDSRLGISFYEPLEEEFRGWIGINRYMQNGEKTNEYQRGYEQYQKIYDRHGMIGAVWASRFITTYEQLKAFAEDETVSF